MSVVGVVLGHPGTGGVVAVVWVVTFVVVVRPVLVVLVYTGGGYNCHTDTEERESCIDPSE